MKADEFLKQYTFPAIDPVKDAVVRVMEDYDHHQAQSRYDEAMEYVKLQPYALHAFVMPVVKRVAEIASGLHIK